MEKRAIDVIFMINISMTYRLLPHPQSATTSPFPTLLTPTVAMQIPPTPRTLVLMAGTGMLPGERVHLGFRVTKP
jgi:hypothetical protein